MQEESGGATSWAVSRTEMRVRRVGFVISGGEEDEGIFSSFWFGLVCGSVVMIYWMYI